MIRVSEQPNLEKHNSINQLNLLFKKNRIPEIIVSPSFIAARLTDGLFFMIN